MSTSGITVPTLDSFVCGKQPAVAGQVVVAFLYRVLLCLAQDVHPAPLLDGECAVKAIKIRSFSKKSIPKIKHGKDS